jgi:serine/threonine protein kinase
LSDFGLSQFLDKMAAYPGNTTTMGGSVRWQAPELLLNDEGPMSLTTSSDIWAFGCTSYEVRVLVIFFL